ncbi:MAG: lysostaphin resistance A-like protein [Ruminococcus sp.]
MTDIKERKINPYDPFDNETENCAYSSSYESIEPGITEKGFELPLLPEKNERKRIRHYFNAAGLGLFAGAIAANIAFIFLLAFLEILMTGSFDAAKMADAENYITNNSSVLIAMNGLIFMFANLIPSIVGSHATGIRMRSYFRPMKTDKTELGKYMVMGIFIQAVTGILYFIISTALEKGGINDYTADIDTYVNAKSIIATALYSCIIAPVTEEILYRGFVMKNLSRVSQHFGIIASAALFGLAHENIAQFILAFPIGIFLGRIAVKHNSLIPSILVHMAVNTFSFGMGILTESVSPDNMGSVILFVSEVVYYFIAGLGMVFWIKEVRKSRLPANTIRQSYRGIRIALTSPWLMAAAIFHFSMAIIAIAMENV